MTAAVTVEYAFDQRITSLAAATRHDFAAVTLTLAETTSRVIKSAHVEITCTDDQTTNTNITSVLIGIKLGAVAFNDATVTDTWSYSNKHKQYVFQRDVTSYFVTNFGASSTQTCQVGVQFGTAPTINHTARLFITYEFAESNTTRTKTVRIPLDAKDLLTNTLTEVGTNQVPILTGGSGILKEASVTITDLFFVVDARPSEPDTTAMSMALALDSEAEVADGQHKQNLSSDYQYRRIWRRTDMVTTSAHAFKARCPEVTNRWRNFCVTLVVTYTYSESSTTTVTNHRAIPWRIEGLTPGTTATPRKHYVDLEIDIQESGSITMLQSGLIFAYTPRTGTAQLDVKVGAGAVRSWYCLATGHLIGPSLAAQRIDSGGSQGSSFTPARGKQTIRIEVSLQTAGFDGAAAWGVSGMLYLNYSSSKTSDTSKHAHTLITPAIQTHATQLSVYGSVSVPVPTGYTIDHVATRSFAISKTNIDNCSSLDIEAATGIYRNAFWDYNFALTLATFYAWTDITSVFAKRAGLPGADPTVSRSLRGASNGNGGSGNQTWCAEVWTTYHVISYAITGTVTGYSGDGSGVTVKIFNASTDELLATTTTIVGGGFSTTIYDNTISIYASAFFDSTHKGRSAAYSSGGFGSVTLSVADPGDAAGPTILFTHPATTNDPLVVTIFDASGLRQYRLTVGSPGSWRWEAYASHLGFAPPFATRSTATGIGSLASPRVLTVYRDGGWPSGVDIDADVVVVDTVGNEAEA